MSERPARYLSEEAWTAAQLVGTASLTTQLLRRGFRNVYLPGLRATRPDLRLAGYAFTLRYVPAREDVVGVEYNNANNMQRIAVESVGPRDVLVVDARGDAGAATLGNILATRMAMRGATGIVTDGGMRDTSLFGDIALPVYYAQAHQTQSSSRHYPADINLPVGCAGVLIMPGDFLIGDADGVVAIPAAVAEEVILAALEQDQREELSLEHILAGESIHGVYPPGQALIEEFERRRG